MPESNNTNWNTLIFASNNNVIVLITGENTVISNASLIIFDKLGNVINKPINHIEEKYEVDLHSGLYTFQINNNNETLVKTIIID